ncbi:UdgX family uracil-DNA binding protein [Horticoccus luteus]|uniref:Type-4 uracil-DNA glycosylase n=1 Tax=Horticoccus luteus TaxID=2862869 RepID=A0A8F9XK68_9BACT|nr:UdgX family uracil-DNA binding protein [Horticoccus luteus]QYM77784.1 UdgX family uracil-DNA binding protein [Horticoccus luteus]
MTAPHGAALAATRTSLRALRDAAADCRACPLWRAATQTVFGEGRRPARWMFVGEQPGDHEDRSGRPFVGPAGRLLDAAMAEAGIDRREVYVTNAVKHFKWVPAGRRRLHQKPNAREVAACRPWLDAEIALVQPEVVVALGATAAQALMGRTFRVTRERGKLLAVGWARAFMATVHPSAILRMKGADREAARQALVEDLRVLVAS